MSEFKATVSLHSTILIPAKRSDGTEVKRDQKDSSTNNRNLEVIRQFDKGNCRVSSIDEVPKLAKNGTKAFAFKVEFNTGDNLDIQQVIERFNAVFVFKALSEVTKN